MRINWGQHMAALIKEENLDEDGNIQVGKRCISSCRKLK
jgi:hypothetical protein